MANRRTLTLAHSGDPDDVFMWWPLTGRVLPDGSRADDSPPRVRGERFDFRAVPGDISLFNRLAARSEREGGAPYDVTALSVRAWADAQDRYTITRVGGSFGEGYGPKVVTSAKGGVGDIDDLRDLSRSIGVPGLRTTACMVMRLMLGGDRLRDERNLIELHFAQVTAMVAGGEVDAGLLIHEAQRTFDQAGLRELADLGAWWNRAHGLPLPLGVNAVRRDLDARYGVGAQREVRDLLEQSLDYAIAHRDESIDATMPFARANARIAGLPEPDRNTVERYVDLYVTRLTRDMGESGRGAIQALLHEGARAGLCPRVERIDIA